ncbi:MAG: membrane protein, partial [Lachnospiraceae bacterium]|nr:membrane protein [Lachnospiraceae bacterium]
VAVLVMCFASSLYMTSNLGVSVYDAIPIVIADRRKLPFKFVRIGCDLLCVIIGTLSGLLPGVGTLITAFFMGPLIEFFNHRFSEPFLFGKDHDEHTSV